MGDTLGAEFVSSGDCRALINTDAQMKATLIGSSKTFIVQDSVLQVGKLGYIYFVVWDQNRERTRHC
ncbi:YjbQ family protein [Thermoanaerobacterium sp. RBIITD]|uniref:YjbQ family protein n=1 Tax=Thermoanaerobacterium sp. RBIITD TaxID=1550240 RepID=UPI0012FDC575